MPVTAGRDWLMPGLTLCAIVVLFSLVWSSAFIAGKIAIQDIDPFSVLCVRFFVSALLLLPFCRNRNGLKSGRELIITGSVLGFLNNAVYLGLTFSSLRFISPGWVVIIAACSPFMTIALAAIMGMERVSARQLVGIGAGFLGVTVMTGVTGLEKDAILGVLLAVAGTLSFSLGTVLFRGKNEGMPIHTLNFWQSLSGTLFLLPIAWSSGSSLSQISFAGAAAIAWLVVVSILGMSLWFMLIRMRGAGTAASYHLLNPVSGLLLSFLILGNAVHLREVAGALLIGMGLLVSTSRSAGK